MRAQDWKDLAADGIRHISVLFRVAGHMPPNYLSGFDRIDELIHKTRCRCAVDNIVVERSSQAQMLPRFKTAVDFDHFPAHTPNSGQYGGTAVRDKPDGFFAEHTHCCDGDFAVAFRHFYVLVRGPYECPEQKIRNEMHPGLTGETAKLVTLFVLSGPDF